MTTSTTTATTRAIQTSALAASTKFRTFALTFAVVGTLTYVVCLFMNWPLFTYHPAVNRLDWGWVPARSGEGPPMYWYGWVAVVLIVGTALALLATFLPESVTKKFPLVLVWLLPFLAIPYFIWDLRQWWFHAP